MHKQTMTGHLVVDAIAKLSFEGHVVPHTWYKHLTYQTKRGSYCHHLAVLMLSDIVYWYRPTAIKNEETGELIGWKKKFKADKLQRSYKDLAYQLGATHKQVTEAAHFLQSKGLITLELRTVTGKNGKQIGNVLFIECNPEEIAQITFSLVPSELLPPFHRNKEKGDTPIAEIGDTPIAEIGDTPIADFGDTPIAEIGETNTKITDPKISDPKISDPIKREEALFQKTKTIDSFPEIQESVKAVEVVEESEVTNRVSSFTIPLPVDKQKQVNANTNELTSQDQKVPATLENDSQQKYSQAVRSMITKWEQTGIAPKAPIEINQWAREVLGEDIIKKYRKSGHIMSTDIGDVDPNFLAFAVKDWKGKDIDAAGSKIFNLEFNRREPHKWSPNDWVVLKMMVLRWEASKLTGDRNLNLAEQYEKATKPQSRFEQMAKQRNGNKKN